MKKVRKGAEPATLADYRQANPKDTWGNFGQDPDRKRPVSKQIAIDQGGLCAYCEIDLRFGYRNGRPDFHVEHFHPQSGRAGAWNWGLDWDNLLGCCHGGSQPNVANAEDRFAAAPSDRSCGIPKGNQVLDDVILNPLHLAASPALFECRRSDGRLRVDSAACKLVSVSAAKAWQTVDSLQLNAARLNRLRKGVLDSLNDKLRQQMKAGQTMQQARAHLAGIMLRKNGAGHWPPFFTSVRSYLGQEAEQRLRSIGYDG